LEIPDMSKCSFAIVLSLSAAAGATAQTTRPAARDDRRTVVIGEKYKKGGIHRFFFGDEYRDLWTTPVSVEVLDLATYAGGLKPTRTVGHGQTQGLAFAGGDGNSYTFRPLLKDPTGLLPDELHQTIARDIVVDQMASGHPAAHVIVPGLLAAAGVLHSEPRLVVIPDDSSLGQYRAEFANVVGDIEMWTGSKGFAGSTETIDGEEMWKRLRKSPEVRADSRAYLRARLVDQLIGDWDRHRGQWRWGKLPGKPRWQPIPEDRDQGFVRFEGAVIAVLRPQLPLLVKFSPDYPNMEALAFDSWDVDKRVLADLPWRDWAEIAGELQAALTDSVLEAAARRMPPEYFAKDGPRLIAGMKARRDDLPEQARRFYRHINKEVDVFCTDVDERVSARRHENGDLHLTVAAKGGDTYFDRRFEERDTSEVRVYLYGGQDEVVVEGGKHGGVQLRVISGDDADVVDDSKGGGTRVSDSRGKARVVDGPGTSVDTRPYTPPSPPASGSWRPPRDWGRRTGPLLLGSYGSDYGVLIGGAFNSTGYGFRKHPWEDKHSLRVLYSTKEKSVRASYAGDFRLENSPLRLSLFGLGSGIEIIRFFGFGNETPLAADKNIYRIRQNRFHLEPSLVYSAGGTDVSLGVVAKHSTTDRRDNPVLGRVIPFTGGTILRTAYSADDFTQFGVSARVKHDGTDGLALPRRGVFLTAGGSFYPKLGDVSDPFGRIHGRARVHLATKGDLAPTLALAAGGERVFGSYPFFEAAFLGGKTPMYPIDPGGASSLRGLPPQRYAGDGAVFGNADAYLPFAKAFFIVPGQIGVTGFYDVGRVFLDRESSSKWHHGYGGGLFFASPGRRNLLSLLYARSEGQKAFYVRAGFAF
jgi:hypothetical protein